MLQSGLSPGAQLNGILGTPKIRADEVIFFFERRRDLADFFTCLGTASKATSPSLP